MRLALVPRCLFYSAVSLLTAETEPSERDSNSFTLLSPDSEPLFAKEGGRRRERCIEVCRPRGTWPSGCVRARKRDGPWGKICTKSCAKPVSNDLVPINSDGIDSDNCS